VGVNWKANDSSNPLQYAAWFGRKEIADLLLKYGGKTGEELKSKGK